jgi:hypothetical protein
MGARASESAVLLQTSLASISCRAKTAQYITCAWSIGERMIFLSQIAYGILRRDFDKAANDVCFYF